MDIFSQNELLREIYNFDPVLLNDLEEQNLNGNEEEMKKKITKSLWI